MSPVNLNQNVFYNYVESATVNPATLVDMVNRQVVKIVNLKQEVVGLCPQLTALQHTQLPSPIAVNSYILSIFQLLLQVHLQLGQKRIVTTNFVGNFIDHVYAALLVVNREALSQPVTITPVDSRPL